MYLLVGLGNPGAEYAKTRHNIGFMAIDRLAQRLGIGGYKDTFKSQLAKTVLGQTDVILAKPQTYMNLSGEAVQQVQAYYKIPLDNIVVVHDELDLPQGTVRIKLGGGAAGHRGLLSIATHCGEGFVRLRMGIGRPIVENYVLSNFLQEEEPIVLESLNNAASALERIVVEGPSMAMNAVNQRRPPNA